jgi:UDP-2,3-diacylglucosamine hydrolase
VRAFFISDLHLKDMKQRNSQKLLRFLLWLEAEIPSQNPPSHLFLVGDIFDLWIGSHQFFVDRFKPIVDQLRRLHTFGIVIHYFEGNHDLYLKSFWQDRIGIKVHGKAENFRLGSFQVRVEHGDLINPDDKGYLFLYRLLRSKPMPWLAKNLPSAMIEAIGLRASRASRNYTSNSKSLKQEKIRSLIRQHAFKESALEKFDFLVTGHVHVQDDQTLRVANHIFRSINLGAWFEKQECFVISQKEAQFRSINEDGSLA